MSCICFYASIECKTPPALPSPAWPFSSYSWQNAGAPGHSHEELHPTYLSRRSFNSSEVTRFR